MKIKTYAFRYLTDQISRIEQGFIQLGHQITDNPAEADLIYINDRTFLDGDFLDRFKCKKIFNILDIPYFEMKDEDYNKWKVFLSKADYVTCISEKVKKDIKNILHIDATVIYNPIKDVKKTNNILSNKMLFVGRANAPTKRFNLIKNVFTSHYLDKNNLYVCGTENPNFGNYLGVVSDDELNKHYNSCDIVLCPSWFEGIGLPMIEALVCGKMPIACNDNETAKEFLPEWFLCDPNENSIAEKIIDYYRNKEKYDSIIFSLGTKYSIMFDKYEIAKKIINILE